MEDGLEGDGAREILFRLVIEPDPEDGGFVATTPTLPGVAGQGETPEEAGRDLAAAIRFTLDDMVENGEPLPESDEEARDYPALEEETPHAFRTAVVV